MKNGYTLMELLFCLLLISIILSVSVAGFESVFSKNKAGIAMLALHRALNFARSEAIVSGQRVKFCLTQDGHTCTNKLASNYLVIMVAHERVIRVFINDKTAIDWHWKSSLNLDGVTFSPMGFANVNGRFQMEGGYQYGALIVSQTGRVRTIRPK